MIILSRASVLKTTASVCFDRTGGFRFVLTSGLQRRRKVTSQIITLKGFDTPAAIHLES